MFNKNLRTIRELRNLSQLQMAKLLGIPISTYRNYENTTRQPGFDILVKMSCILNVSVDKLLNNESPAGKYAEILYKTKALPLSDVAEVENYIDYLIYKNKKKTKQYVMTKKS